MNQPLTEEKLRDLFTEYCSITDRYAQALIRKDKLLLDQQNTIDELREENERLRKVAFDVPEKAEVPDGN